MRRATALKVADTLALVEAYLEKGRPRKLPGKPRAEAEDFYGRKPLRVTKWTYDNELYGKVSLVGAFKAIRFGERYSYHVIGTAKALFIAEAEKDGWKTGIHEVSDIDFYEPDTRQLIRYAKAARRKLEKDYGL